MSEPRGDPRRALREVAVQFTKLGFIGFGGPAAHVAMMRRELVQRRDWVDDSEFLDIVGATNLIPGPNSTELAMHLGSRRAGWRGLVVAGLGFILPAVAIVSVLAWLYERHGTSPAIADVRYGVLPVVVAIVAHAVTGLSRTTATAHGPVAVAAIGGAAFVAYRLQVHELLILAVAGVLMMAWSARRRLVGRASLMVWVPVLLGQAPPPPDTPRSLLRLFLVFLEIGSVLYGSGYVLLAYLERRLVDDLGWITTQEMLDAVAVGQVTPGPLFTTATFVGWQVDGPAGAAVATVGIFLPSFVFVAFLTKLVPWIRASATRSAFLAGVTIASLGLMAGVLVDLTDAALSDWGTVVVALATLAALLTTKWNTAWLVAAGLAVSAVHAVVA